MRLALRTGSLAASPRGAGFSIVWPEILATSVIGAVYFGFALNRFRRVIFSG